MLYSQISMYINSPGGVVTAGLAIYDTMQVSARQAQHHVQKLQTTLKLAERLQPASMCQCQ